MRRLYQSLMLVLATATDRELARMVQFLRAENQILYARLTERIAVTPKERRRLVRLGRGLGAKLRELITVVSYRTFTRWLADNRRPRPPAQRGRPRAPQPLRDLIVEIATRTGWGYSRILGELRKLTSRKVSRQFVVNVLKEHGLDPSPERRESTWTEFVRSHAATLWQCDFFGVRTLTARGWKEYFVLAFINVATRRVVLSEPTLHPHEAWVVDQADRFCDAARDLGLAAGTVTRDNDGKFGSAFDERLTARGVKAKRLTVASPNLQAYVERWIQSVRVEALDRFVILGERHLNHILHEFVAHYHEARPHQGLDNRPLTGRVSDDPTIPRRDELRVVGRLGGVLHHFERRVA